MPARAVVYGLSTHALLVFSHLCSSRTTCSGKTREAKILFVDQPRHVHESRAHAHGGHDPGSELSDACARLLC